MKKIMMVTLIATALSLSTMAQENNGQQGRPRMDRSEMIQRRTDEMAKQYGLDAKQQKKLLKLNKKYPEAMPFMGRRPGGQGWGMRGGNGGPGRPQAGQGDGQRQPGNGQMGQGPRGNGQGGPRGGWGQGGPRGNGQMGQGPRGGWGQGGPRGGRMGQGPRGGRGSRQADPEVMKKYEKQLQKIMTSEQFAKYQAERKAQEERRRQAGAPSATAAPGAATAPGTPL